MLFDLSQISRSIGRLVESDIEGGIGNEWLIYGRTDDRVFEGGGGEHHSTLTPSWGLFKELGEF